MCDNIIEKKICTKCGVEKELGEFTVLKATNKHESKCKECKNAYTREYIKKNQNRIKSDILKNEPNFKICSKCGKSKKIEDFPFNGKRNKHEARCNDCGKKYRQQRHRGLAEAEERAGRISKKRKISRNRNIERENPGIRFCARCNELKNIEEFNFRKKANRYCSWCRVCEHEYDKKRYWENEGKMARRRNEKIQYINSKSCSKCGEIKSLDSFLFLPSTNQYHSWCKGCCEIVRKQDAAKNKIKSKSGLYTYPDHQICSECNIDKDISKFSFIVPYNRYDYRCKECVRKYNKEYIEEYTEEDRLLHNVRCMISYYRRKEKDYEGLLRNGRNFRKNNPDKVKGYRKKFYHEKQKTSVECKIRNAISKCIGAAIKQNGSFKNGKSCLVFLLYTILQLMQYLESLFEWWMTWDNWGQYRVDKWDDNDPSTWTWQIDHIIPHSFFKYTSMDSEEFRQCWALENLRPLSAKENLLKRDKIDIEVFNKLYPILVNKAKNV